jgi:hypothetical protein
MGVGALIGTSIGYLNYRHTDEEKAILRGAAYGAIAGAFLGLGIGVADASDGRRGGGSIVLHDMRRGALLGLAAGAIYGSVEGITDGEWEKLGDGAAWGYLAGSVAGLAIGIYESSSREDRSYSYRERAERGALPRFAPLRDPRTVTPSDRRISVVLLRAMDGRAPRPTLALQIAS